MPTSDVHNIVPVLTIMQHLQPQSVLDIGCGFGKYGVLLREYLDVWHERLDPAHWQARLEGIDAFAQYRNPIWDYVYQTIYTGEVQQILPTLGKYDAVLMADVIEHLERTDARSLVKQCLEHSPVLIVSTPREFYPQQDTNENPYERHRILWTAADFPAGMQVATISGLGCNIYVASRAPLPWQVTYLADLRNVLYLQSRHKLRRFGRLSWPVSTTLRLVNRLLA
jgi:hypothetical protein